MQDDLELTQEQLVAIANYAKSVLANERKDVTTEALATALLTVAVCLHRCQAGDPPAFGPDADIWYDSKIGQNMRVNWMKVKPAQMTLQKLGIL
jgi:hypothetical protein